MSIRLDPRRVNALKHLAGEAGVRPGDLVRQWIEERIDGARMGDEAGAPRVTSGLATQFEALVARVAALEAAAGMAPPEPATQGFTTDEPETAVAEPPDDTSAPGESQPPTSDAEPEPEPEPEPGPAAATKRRGRPRTKVSAAPSERVALHDEMIAVLREHGPMTAGELAGAIADRGRYMPPRSGKPLDAAMVSQRVSNPVYRARFTRNAGRIGLAEAE